MVFNWKWGRSQVRRTTSSMAPLVQEVHGVRLLLYCFVLVASRAVTPVTAAGVAAADISGAGAWDGAAMRAVDVAVTLHVFEGAKLEAYEDRAGAMAPCGGVKNDGSAPYVMATTVLLFVGTHNDVGITHADVVSGTCSAGPVATNDTYSGPPAHLLWLLNPLQLCVEVAGDVKCAPVPGVPEHHARRAQETPVLVTRLTVCLGAQAVDAASTRTALAAGSHVVLRPVHDATHAGAPACLHWHWTDGDVADSACNSAPLNTLSHGADASRGRFLWFPLPTFDGFSSQKAVMASYIRIAGLMNRTLVLPYMLGDIFAHFPHVVRVSDVFDAAVLAEAALQQEHVHVVPPSADHPWRCLRRRRFEPNSAAAVSWTDVASVQTYAAAVRDTVPVLVVVTDADPFQDWLPVAEVRHRAEFACGAFVLKAPLQRVLDTSLAVHNLRQFIAIHMRVELDWRQFVHRMNSSFGLPGAWQDGADIRRRVLAHEAGAMFTDVVLVGDMRAGAIVGATPWEGWPEHIRVWRRQDLGVLPGDGRRSSGGTAVDSAVLRAAVDFELAKRATLFVGNMNSGLSWQVMVSRSTSRTLLPSFVYNLEPVLRGRRAAETITPWPLPLRGSTMPAQHLGEHRFFVFPGWFNMRPGLYCGTRDEGEMRQTAVRRREPSAVTYLCKCVCVCVCARADAFSTWLANRKLPNAAPCRHTVVIGGGRMPPLSVHVSACDDMQLEEAVAVVQHACRHADVACSPAEEAALVQHVQRRRTVVSRSRR